MLHHTPLIATIVVGLVLAFVFGAIAHRLKHVAAGGLSAGRRRGRALHAGLRRRSAAGGRAGRDRRDPADVRRRPAFLAEGPAVGAGDRHARRDRADRPSRPLLGLVLSWALGWSLGAGLVFGLALSVASTVVLLRALQERQPDRDRARPHRRRLADRRGSGHGAGAGAAAGAGRPARRRRRRGGRILQRRGCRARPGDHPRQGRRLRRC